MKLLVCDALSDSAVAGLQSIEGLDVTVKTGMDIDTLKETIVDYNIAIVRSATKLRKETLDVAKNLKLIIRGGVGLDNIDLDHAASLGIKVANTPSASSNSVAELAMAMMFVISRNLYNSTLSMKEGKWEKKKFKGFELAGKKLGIIGCGRIGQYLAQKAIGIGMDVIGYDIKKPETLVEGMSFTSDLNEMLKCADFISLHVPFIASVGAILKTEQFNIMKDGVCIVNAARGGVVCEKSLIEALNNGKVKAAAIDVFEKEPTENKELLEHPGVIALSPHIGAQTKEAQDRVGDEIVSIVKDFIK